MKTALGYWWLLLTIPILAGLDRAEEVPTTSSEVSEVDNSAISSRTKLLIQGTWNTPYGCVQLKSSGQLLVGILGEKSPVCNFYRGTEILHGRLANDIFIGEVRACWEESGCSSREWFFVIASFDTSTDKIMGVVESRIDPGCSKSPFPSHLFELDRRSLQSLQSECRNSLPSKVNALFQKANASLQDGDYESAQRAFFHSLRLNPNDPEVLRRLAITFMTSRDTARARKYLEKALHFAPSNDDTHYLLACALSREGKTRESLRSLQRAVENGYAFPQEMDSDPDLQPLREKVPFEYSMIRQMAQKNGLARSATRTTWSR